MFTCYLQSLNSQYVGVVGENGLVKVWTLQQPRTMHLNTTCSDIFATGHLSSFRITDDGIVFIMLRNGSSYSYSKQLDSW